MNKREEREALTRQYMAEELEKIADCQTEEQTLRAAGVVTVDDPSRQAHRWGERGVRYDESCGRCGQDTDVDNTSGLCARCHRQPMF